MKDVNFTKFITSAHFKKMTIEELRESASFNLVDDDGKFIAIVVVPASAFKKDQIQGLCSQMNAAMGKE